MIIKYLIWGIILVYAVLVIIYYLKSERLRPMKMKHTPYWNITFLICFMLFSSMVLFGFPIMLAFF
jgi:hypothetical protein